MPEITRRAEVLWQGGLLEGSGVVTVGSRALTAQPVSWAARTEDPGGKTSPEELVAAAHASCYAMAFSGVLARNDYPPEELTVTAVVTLAPKEGGGFAITQSALSVEGRVPGLDADQFEELARQGEQGCPVSNALRGNVDITIQASLQA